MKCAAGEPHFCGKNSHGAAANRKPSHRWLANRKPLCESIRLSLKRALRSKTAIFYLPGMMAALSNSVNTLESGKLCGDGALQPCVGKTTRQDKGHARMYGQDIGAGWNGHDGESIAFAYARHHEHGHPSDMEQHITLWGRLPNPTCWHQAAPCA